MALCLVVEDMPVTRKIYERMLTKLGFDVVQAPDCATALAICAETMPDVALVDWNLPDRDGIHFVAELRKLEGGDRPKVLMATVENSIKHIQRAIEAGADEYVMKAFTQEILADKLRIVGAIG